MGAADDPVFLDEDVGSLAGALGKPAVELHRQPERVGERLDRFHAAGERARNDPAHLERTKELDVRIFGGLGGVFLLEELMAGAAGAMTGFAFPAILVKIVTLFRAGRVSEAGDVFYAKVPLMRFEFQEGIGMAIRKEVLRRRGMTTVFGNPGSTEQTFLQDF